MSEEINTEIFKNVAIDNTGIEKENNSSNAEIKTKNNITSNELNEPKQEDESKVKIHTILKQRFKNSSPFFKRALPLIIVGIICFGAGLVVGKEIDRHSGRVIMNRKGIFRQMPYGNFNGGNFNKRPFNKNNNNNNNNNNQKNAVPPASNSQPQ